MTTLAGAIVGLLAGAGLWLAIAGWRGVAVPERPRRSINVEGLWWRAGLVVAAFLAGVIITGWPAAGALAGYAGVPGQSLVVTLQQFGDLPEQQAAQRIGIGRAALEFVVQRAQARLVAGLVEQIGALRVHRFILRALRQQGRCLSGITQCLVLAGQAPAQFR